MGTEFWSQSWTAYSSNSQINVISVKTSFVLTHCSYRVFFCARNIYGTHLGNVLSNRNNLLATYSRNNHKKFFFFRSVMKSIHSSTSLNVLTTLTTCRNLKMILRQLSLLISSIVPSTHARRTFDTTQAQDD